MNALTVPLAWAIGAASLVGFLFTHNGYLAVTVLICVLFAFRDE